MEGGSSGKTMTVSSRTLQKSKLASNKEIIIKTDRPQTSTLREEPPLKGSSRVLKPSLSVCEVGNETVGAQAGNHHFRAREQLCVCVCVCSRHVSTGRLLPLVSANQPGRKLRWISESAWWNNAVFRRLGVIYLHSVLYISDFYSFDCAWQAG